MEKQTVLPIHTSRPLDSFFKRSRLLADDLFEMTIWIRGWDTRIRRPSFSGVAKPIVKNADADSGVNKNDLLYLLSKLKRL